MKSTKHTSCLRILINISTHFNYLNPSKVFQNVLLTISTVFRSHTNLKMSIISALGIL